MQNQQKSIASILKVVGKNIADINKIANVKMDTVVNAAKPTLMGSNQGVDGAIHKAIDNHLPNDECFRDKICKEILPGEENVIRCGRGKVILTPGYGWCKYVIHAVGSKYDGTSSKPEDCSSSRVKILESCYYEIVNQLKNHLDIENVAVPIIGAGEYGFPFEMAAEIAIASIGNALIEWYEQDPEIFGMARLEGIYFCIYNESPEQKSKDLSSAEQILQKYMVYFENHERVVYQLSYRAHKHYINEVDRYDEHRGYFSIARGFRKGLLLFRLLFMPYMWIKDKVGRHNWKKRREFVERLAAIKILIPILFWGILKSPIDLQIPILREVVFPVVIIYNLSDTITYLLTLIIMADIQRPSANIIRSVILLFVNYIEVAFDIAFLYYLKYSEGILFREAAVFGLLGMSADIKLVSIGDYLFICLHTGIKFFFISLVFGYFANHMRQRKFRS